MSFGDWNDPSVRRQFRITKSQDEDLDEMAEKYGVNKSDLVRLGIETVLNNQPEETLEKTEIQEEFGIDEITRVNDGYFFKLEPQELEATS